MVIILQLQQSSSTSSYSSNSDFIQYKSKKKKTPLHPPLHFDNIDNWITSLSSNMKISFGLKFYNNPHLTVRSTFSNLFLTYTNRIIFITFIYNRVHVLLERFENLYRKVYLFSLDEFIIDLSIFEWGIDKNEKTVKK